jgi:hypothetical protein
MYSPVAEKEPYLVTAGDDKPVKVWDIEKAES